MKIKIDDAFDHCIAALKIITGKMKRSEAKEKNLDLDELEHWIAAGEHGMGIALAHKLRSVLDQGAEEPGAYPAPRMACIHCPNATGFH